jgi:hypothetical protein
MVATIVVSISWTETILWPILGIVTRSRVLEAISEVVIILRNEQGIDTTTRALTRERWCPLVPGRIVSGRRGILSVTMYRPIVHRLWAVVIDLSATIGMLAKVRVPPIIRCASATIVDGGSMMMIYCPPAIVGTIFHDEVAIIDVYVANILEEGGLH